jgi:formylglycine-generating enzyme required for sulfatase activity
MKPRNPRSILSISVGFWTNSTGLIFARDPQKVFYLCLGFLLLASAATLHVAAAGIQEIRMVAHDRSTVPRLLIEAEIGKTITIEYVDTVQSVTWRALTNSTLTNDPFVFVDLTATGVQKRFYRLAKPIIPPANPNPARFVWIQPGTFTMGSPATEQDRYAVEGPQTVVTLTKGFYMGKYEVTQKEYLAIMTNNPSYFQEGRIVTTTPGVEPPPLAGDLNRPVEWMTWTDAASYCKKLTDKEREAGRLPTGWEYRLPTEAQWEYANRAGTKTRYPFGDDPTYSDIHGYGWHFPMSSNLTHPVGQKQPNAWGLYDMSGNVWEWCADFYDRYPGGSVTDPQGPTFGAFRVNRGGSWFSHAVFGRPAYRAYTFPDYSDGNIGFRVVLAQSQP